MQALSLQMEWSMFSMHACMFAPTPLCTHAEACSTAGAHGLQQKARHTCMRGSSKLGMDNNGLHHGQLCNISAGMQPASKRCTHKYTAGEACMSADQEGHEVKLICSDRCRKPACERVSRFVALQPAGRQGRRWGRAVPWHPTPSKGQSGDVIAVGKHSQAGIQQLRVDAPAWPPPSVDWAASC